MVVVGYASWFRKGGASSRFGRIGRARRPGAGSRPAGESTDNEPQVKYWRGRRIEEKPDPPDSGDPNDRGKIIEFGPPVDDLDPGDRGEDEK